MEEEDSLEERNFPYLEEEDSLEESALSGLVPSTSDGGTDSPGTASPSPTKTTPSPGYKKKKSDSSGQEYSLWKLTKMNSCFVNLDES